MSPEVGGHDEDAWRLRAVENEAGQQGFGWDRPKLRHGELESSSRAERALPTKWLQRAISASVWSTDAYLPRISAVDCSSDREGLRQFDCLPKVQAGAGPASADPGME
ncbi:hypothetical protein Plec18167_007133 [Paecilomyces lecythidis]|uniref:Uncharacterized protein n=1 Tax=Paecilomyces lecythidis TaxID=3004212 RepID=A0ABR3X614_9EURO